MADRPPMCSFCGKPDADVERLVAGPGVYICDKCVELCVEIIAEDRAKSRPETGRPRMCSFCGKPDADVERLVAGPGVYICDKCVELCVEIIAEDRAKSRPENRPLGIPVRPQPFLRLWRAR